MPYRHLSKEERYVIYHLTLFGLGPNEIGRRLSRSGSTISREVRRNRMRHNEVYYHENAQYWSDLRRQQAKRPTKRNLNDLYRYVIAGLQAGWSPETITGRIRLEYPRQSHMRISHECIYQWVYRDRTIGGNLYEHL